MRISKSEIVWKQHDASFRVKVESSRGSGVLWYSVQAKFGDLLTDACDAPLAALLIPAMTTGEDIHVIGPVSERLWSNLSGPYQKLLQRIMPWLRHVNILPTEFRTLGRSATGVATGFSGGIDSYGVLADHYGPAGVSDASRVTHLLFNNTGSHGEGGERLFHERFSRLAPAAERMRLPFVMVDSNLPAFYGKGIGYQQTHTLRNASVALLLQGGIRRYMYASTYCYADVFVGESEDMAFTDTIALPLLSTEDLDVCSVGSEYTRVEKTLRVTEVPASYSTLDVCANAHHAAPPTNCSKCWKCMRTLLTLDIAGVVDRYSDVFDLDLYRRHKRGYVGQVLKSHAPLLREIVEFAHARGHSFPVWLHLYSHLYNSVSRIRHSARMRRHRPAAT